MAKVEVINVEGKKVKELTLNDNVFGIEPNMNVVHSVVLNYLANQRQGTQNTKTRAEPVVEENLGDKKVQDVQDKVL